MTNCCPDIVGANPVSFQWVVTRGDTSPLRVYFYEPDEVSFFDMTGWDFTSTAYDFKNDISDELEISVGEGYVDITAPASITGYWGTGYATTVAELAFDLQVTLTDDSVWTSVIGTIKVLGDVTGGSL
jgi:hypothetical protein